MKIYHKFLLYQNKLHSTLTYGCQLGVVDFHSLIWPLILLIVGVVYEHGFPIIQRSRRISSRRLYNGGVDCLSGRCHPSHISLEYTEYPAAPISKLSLDTERILLYLTLSTRSFSIVRRRRAPSCRFWEFLHGKAYHLVLLLVFSFSQPCPTGWCGCWGGVRTLRLISGCQVSWLIIMIGTGLLMLAALHDERHYRGSTRCSYPPVRCASRG